MFSPPFLHLTFFSFFFCFPRQHQSTVGLIHPFLLRNERISLPYSFFFGSVRHAAAALLCSSRCRRWVPEEALPLAGRGPIAGAGRAGHACARTVAGASQSPPSSAPPLMEAVGAGQRRRNGRATAGQGTLVIQRCLGKQKKKEKMLNGEKRRKHLFSMNSQSECQIFNDTRIGCQIFTCLQIGCQIFNFLTN